MMNLFFVGPKDWRERSLDSYKSESCLYTYINGIAFIFKFIFISTLQHVQNIKKTVFLFAENWHHLNNNCNTARYMYIYPNDILLDIVYVCFTQIAIRESANEISLFKEGSMITRFVPLWIMWCRNMLCLLFYIHKICTDATMYIISVHTVFRVFENHKSWSRTVPKNI